MGLIDRFVALRDATAAALIEAPGDVAPEVRRAIAFGTPPADLAELVQKIRSNARSVTDADVDALRARYSEDALFEIIVSAAFGAAHERLMAARRVLEEA
jgi:alkylhydroperoxidase family enzyme